MPFINEPGPTCPYKKRYWCYMIKQGLSQFGTSLVAQIVKNLPAMWATWIQSLGWGDPHEEGRQPSPVFSPGEFHRQRSLVGYSPWGSKESDKTEELTLTFFMGYTFTLI